MRQNLPWREKAECFLVTRTGQVVAQDRGSYVMFSGGGLDTGESLLKSARREIMEEVGATCSGLKHLATVDWVWFPEWASNAKRKLRYAEYQGERVHIIVGFVDSFGRSTSAEGDAWAGKKTMSIKGCLDLVRRYGQRDHPNTYPYRIAQQMALQYLALLARAGP
jgi:hypothetical protein